MLVVNKRKPDALKHKVLFINADREYAEGKKELLRYLNARKARAARHCRKPVGQVRGVESSGRIIEQYTDTGRGESCLLVGFTDGGKPVHAVCGAMGEWMVIITVYIPTPPKFKNPYERGGS